FSLFIYFQKKGCLQMNVISLDAARKRKQHKKLMITIPIITRIYEEDGEIKFEVAGEKDVPLEMLEK
ncbi:hypothetical protein, partial [Bacillus cereus]